MRFKKMTINAFYRVFSKIHTSQANKSETDFFHTHLFNEKHVEKEEFTQWKQCENGNSSAETLHKLQESIRKINRRGSHWNYCNCFTLRILTTTVAKGARENPFPSLLTISVSISLLLTNTRTITAIPTAASIMSWEEKRLIDYWLSKQLVWWMTYEEHIYIPREDWQPSAI